MAKFEVHAGDFSKGSASLSGDTFKILKKNSIWGTENISTKELALIELATEESVKKIGGTVGWGLAGAAILGPVGLLAGLLLGGKGKEITFIAKFKDGRKLIATTDSKTYTKLQALSFDSSTVYFKKEHLSKEMEIGNKYKRFDGKIYILTSEGLTPEGKKYATYGHNDTIKQLDSGKYTLIKDESEQVNMTNPSTDLDKLLKLSELLENGLLTKNEFIEQKKKLFN